MSVYEKVKQLALDELKAKGYAPNPADVHGIAASVVSLVESEVKEAVEAALADIKASQPAQASTQVTTPPKT